MKEKLAQRANKIIEVWLKGKITDNEANLAMKEVKLKFEIMGAKNASSR